MQLFLSTAYDANKQKTASLFTKILLTKFFHLPRQMLYLHFSLSMISSSSPVSSSLVCETLDGRLFTLLLSLQ